MRVVSTAEKCRYIVSYDLEGENRRTDYGKLEERLETKYKAKRLLQSVWGLSSTLSRNEIFNDLKKLTKIGDGIFIIRVGNGNETGLENKFSSF